MSELSFRMAKSWKTVPENSDVEGLRDAWLHLTTGKNKIRKTTGKKQKQNETGGVETGFTSTVKEKINKLVLPNLLEAANEWSLFTKFKSHESEADETAKENAGRVDVLLVQKKSAEEGHDTNSDKEAVLVVEVGLYTPDPSRKDKEEGDFIAGKRAFLEKMDRVQSYLLTMASSQAARNEARGGVLKMKGPVMVAVVVINKEEPGKIFLGAFCCEKRTDEDSEIEETSDIAGYRMCMLHSVRTETNEEAENAFASLFTNSRAFFKLRRNQERGEFEKWIYLGPNCALVKPNGSPELVSNRPRRSILVIHLILLIQLSSL